MGKQQVTKEAMRALARLSGLDLSDERLEALLPQMQATLEAVSGLNALDMEGIEPAVTFEPDRG